MSWLDAMAFAFGKRSAVLGAKPVYECSFEDRGHFPAGGGGNSDECHYCERIIFRDEPEPQSAGHRWFALEDYVIEEEP